MTSIRGDEPARHPTVGETRGGFTAARAGASCLFLAAAALAALGRVPAHCSDAVFTATGAFRVGYPGHYEVVSYLHEPIPNVEFTDNVPPLAKAVLRVERYSGTDGQHAGEKRFVQNLLEGVKNPKVESRKVSGKDVKVYSNIELVSVRRARPDHDPYGRVLLGVQDRPWLGIFDWRPFPLGGEAFKLYRCKKYSVYGNLHYYEKARAEARTDPKAWNDFRDFYLSDERGLQWPRKLEACVGWMIVARMRAGESIQDIMPKEPSMAELRAMARREYEARDEVRRDLLAVAVVPYRGGYYAIRYRARAEDYKAGLGAFERMLSSFQLLQP